MNVLRFESPADVDSAVPLVAAHLERGGLLAYPTETVYGLGCRAKTSDLRALARMTERPDDKPFLVLVAGRQMVHDCSLRFTAAAERLAAVFWPGPVTLVLAGGESVFPPLLRGNTGGIAVRWSSHTATSRLIACLALPISSTSANLSGCEPLTDVAGIIAQFEAPAEAGDLLVLDGGALRKSPSSTLVDCTTPVPTVLREGAVSRDQIMACLEEAGA